MAINYFIGWSQKDLEVEHEAAQEDLAAGKNTAAAGAGDPHVQSHIELTPQQRIVMILRAFNVIDSTTYPIDQITAITSARVGFATPTSIKRL